MDPELEEKIKEQEHEQEQEQERRVERRENVTNLSKKQFKFKILVTGNSNAGKTSILRRYVDEVFESFIQSTIGVDFSTKILPNIEGEKVVLQLWDIAGQERFGSMTDIYYKNALGAIIVFDITNITTFEAVSKWHSDILEKIKPYTDIPIVLIGNKIDLIQDDIENKSCIKPEQLNEYIKQKKNIKKWFFTSAKENIGISEAIITLTKEILNRVKEGDLNQVDQSIIRNLKTGKFDTTNQTKKEEDCCLSN